MKYNRNLLIIVQGIVIVSICVAISLFLWADSTNTSLATLISHICTRFYRFSIENISAVVGFTAIRIKNRSIFIYVYLIIIVSSVAALFLRRLEQRIKKDKIVPKPQPHSTFIIALIVFFLILSVQLIFQINRLIQERETFFGKTVVEKNLIIFKKGRKLTPYKFAKFCQDRFPGSHKGKYISGLTTKSSLGLWMRYAIAYHIYPINITIPSDQPIDCYVVFKKSAPLAAVPNEFTKYYTFDRHSVLAIKEEAE